MADVPEYFSDTAQEKSEANDAQIINCLSKKEKQEEREMLRVLFKRELEYTDAYSEPVHKRCQQNLIFTSFNKNYN